MTTLICFALKEEAAPFHKIAAGKPGTFTLIVGIGRANAEKSVRHFLTSGGALPSLLLAWLPVLAAGADTEKTNTTTVGAVPHLRAWQVFDERQPVIFQHDFQAGLGKWRIDINTVGPRAALDQPAQDQLIQVVDAPDMTNGQKAVRFVIPREFKSFRSEISLPYEEGFQERWYGARLYVPTNWVFSSAGGDIVLQWHAVLGAEVKSRNFPPLSIHIENDRWKIHRAFGPLEDIQRDAKLLEGPVQRGGWVAWVCHVRWSSATNGWIQIWKDGQPVWEVKGPNTYSTQPRTPYFKTGLYHPEWKQTTPEVERVIYATEVKVGNEKATYEDVAPKS